MHSQDDSGPTASLETLAHRARLLAAMRRFFDNRGYVEVDTPLLSHERVIDAHLDPFVVAEGGREGCPLYLQTSPEFAMKRLLAAGATAIYQLGHVFRRGERGQRHNPEFMMLEWYRAGSTHLDQMQVVEDLVAAIFREAGRTAAEIPFRRTTYREAFLRATGADAAVMSAAELAALAGRLRVPAPDGLGDDRDAWLNLLLATTVEPTLGQDRPEFICDYPASQAALARIRPGTPPVGERFELYLRGIELCNGYHELLDPQELRQRIGAESARRAARGGEPLPAPARLLAAMDRGLPDCSGVALGVDRLVMLALGAESVDAVIPFPFERA